MPITVFPSVDLPQPLSPTRPTVSPGHTASDTPSTARSHPTRRPKALRTAKYRARSTTSSSGAFGSLALTSRSADAGSALDARRGGTALTSHSADVGSALDAPPRASAPRAGGGGTPPSRGRSAGESG